MDDTQGRTYVKMSELHPGDVIEIGTDFSCMVPNSRTLVLNHEGLLCVRCDHGYHLLISQLAAPSDDSLIGMYKVT